jgi:hypothetical protein
MKLSDRIDQLWQGQGSERRCAGGGAGPRHGGSTPRKPPDLVNFFV